MSLKDEKRGTILNGTNTKTRRKHSRKTLKTPEF
jgi:hypothetical protein